MIDQIPQNSTDIELQRFYRYFNSIKDRDIMDAEVKKTCINSIANLFVDNFHDLEQYNMPEFQVLNHLSSKAEIYTRRFSELLELFIIPEIHKYMLFALCENLGAFISAVRAADIHFLYAKKEEILQCINSEVELQLMKVSRLVPPDIAESMKRLVRNLNDPDFGDDANPDISPMNPSDGGICLNPFEPEWEEVNSLEGLHHYIDPDDYRVLSLNEQ